MITVQKGSFNINELHSQEIELQAKVTKVIFELNSINAISEISEIYNALKSAKTESISAYDSLSNILKEELITLVEDIFQLKLKVIELEKRIDYISSEIKEYAASTDPAKVLNTSEEYQNFLTAYQISLGFAQDIVKKNSRVEVILETQKLLDIAYASKMVEIDYQIINLNKIITDFQKVRTASLSKAYAEEFDNCRGYRRIILEKDHKFDQVREEFKIKTSGLYPSNPFSKAGPDSIDSIFSRVADKFPLVGS